MGCFPSQWFLIFTQPGVMQKLLCPLTWKYERANPGKFSGHGFQPISSSPSAVPQEPPALLALEMTGVGRENTTCPPPTTVRLVLNTEEPGCLQKNKAQCIWPLLATTGSRGLNLQEAPLPAAGLYLWTHNPGRGARASQCITVPYSHPALVRSGPTSSEWTTWRLLSGSVDKKAQETVSVQQERADRWRNSRGRRRARVQGRKCEGALASEPRNAMATCTRTCTRMSREWVP